MPHYVPPQSRPLGLVLLGFVALAQAGCPLCRPDEPERSTPEPTVTPVGCQKDTDCKGARVCVNGTCTESGSPRVDNTVRPPQPLPTAEPLPNFDGIPDPGSAMPSGEEFNAVPREVTVTGSSALHCETKMVREWLRVVCRQQGEDIPTYARFDQTGGVQTSLAPPGNGFVSALMQVVRGKTVKVMFAWDTGGRSWGQTLTVTWPVAAGRPSMYFTPEG